MKTIKAIIEKGADGGYAIYIPAIEGIYGTGATEQEAKAELQDAIDSAREYADETGDWGDYASLKKEVDIEYAYDLSGFFKTYDFFDVTALATHIGLNSSLLRRYKTGISKASDATKQKIEKGIHAIANDLIAARF